MTKFQKKLWIGVIVLALLTPLGTLLPEKFKAAEAWGEWGTDKLEKLLGYVPEGLRKLANFWKAPIISISCLVTSLALRQISCMPGL